MHDLVTTAGGLIVNEKKKNEADVWIVDEDSDKKLIDSLLKSKNENEISVCTIELLLDGILK